VGARVFRYDGIVMRSGGNMELVRASILSRTPTMVCARVRSCARVLASLTGRNHKFPQEIG